MSKCRLLNEFKLPVMYGGEAQYQSIEINLTLQEKTSVLQYFPIEQLSQK